MNVSAVIVTRGDVDLAPIRDAYALAGIKSFTWDNSRGNDLSVYGRYAVIETLADPVVLVQDDDVILPPESINALLGAYTQGHVVANMPARFRHDFYSDHCLVGFGAIFDSWLPYVAFAHLWLAMDWPLLTGPEVPEHRFFYRTCDVVFTTLTPRILVDVPYTDREFASAPNRMWKQPGHVSERQRMLELARKVRDAVPA